MFKLFQFHFVNLFSNLTQKIVNIAQCHSRIHHFGNQPLPIKAALHQIFVSPCSTIAILNLSLVVNFTSKWLTQCLIFQKGSVTKSLAGSFLHQFYFAQPVARWLGTRNFKTILWEAFSHASINILYVATLQIIRSHVSNIIQSLVFTQLSELMQCGVNKISEAPKWLKDYLNPDSSE